MAGAPTGSPSPGLVTTPTPSPRSRSNPCSPRHEMRAVRCAPSVTSGSSPASLMTTASAHESPSSQRSTSNSTRRSRPFPGSFMSTRSCFRPLWSAQAAALAAAAAQAPVVQPVLSFWPLTFSMLGGMEGSRSLRGGICSLLRRFRPAEHVRELGAVEVRTRPASRETRADQYERLPGKVGLSNPVSEVLEAALYDFLVGPTRPVDHGARSLGCVAALQEFLLQGARLRSGEEDRHGRSVLRETPYVLALRHRGAARAARQDHRLRDLGHGQLSPDGRSGGTQRGDPRDYLPIEAKLVAKLDLLHHGPVQTGVARMHPGHFQVLFHGPLVEPSHAFQRYGRRLYYLGARAGVLEYTFVHEAPGPDHHVGLTDEPGSPDRQQIRRPRPSPDEPHLSQARNPYQ